jgi:cell division protein ZapA
MDELSVKIKIADRDKQDLLAMVAFDCLVDKMAEEESLQVIDETVAEKVNHLNQLVSQAL